MQVENPQNRLKSLWGYIDRQHNAQIAKCLKPNSKVLDFGCGYGTLVNYLTEHQFDAIGLDIDKESVDIARNLFPNIIIHEELVEEFAQHHPESFDAIILRDAFHHLLNEHNVDSGFNAFSKLLKPGGRIIIFDPNPMWILRTARQIIHHIDPEASLDSALEILRKYNFDIQDIRHYEVIGLPLSGGYVGYQLVPNIAFLNQGIATTNQWLSLIINNLGLGSQFCWRYIVFADKQASSV